MEAGVKVWSGSTVGTGSALYTAVNWMEINTLSIEAGAVLTIAAFSMITLASVSF